jgi:high-affinity nickel-transport protein
MDPGNSAPFAIALLGLLLGMRHATDPDHVIAVTAILSRERRLATAARIGVVWGLGHTLTVVAIGAAMIVFKLAIPARLGLAMEFAVALVLILLGLGAVCAILSRLAARLFANAPVAHLHQNTLHHYAQVHPHKHYLERRRGSDMNDQTVVSNCQHGVPSKALQSFGARRPLLRSFSVGLVHGLAGSAAIALLVLSAIPRPLWATLYLAIFCAGTIIGMGLITTAISTSLIVASTRMSSLHQRFVASSGLLSFGFGLFLAYRIGVIDQLFGAAPIWSPH